MERRGTGSGAPRRLSVLGILRSLALEHVRGRMNVDDATCSFQNAQKLIQATVIRQVKHHAWVKLRVAILRMVHCKSAETS